MFVFVMSSDLLPLCPCHPARARKLLSTGRAAVYRRFPFTIVLKERSAADSTVQEHTVKIDPGARKTGVAVLQGSRVVWAAEIDHRGFQVRAALTARRTLRRGRRNRKTRYRAPRFLNRTRRPDWLPPSLESRVANVETWVRRLVRFCPITGIAQELVRFDLQKQDKPDIAGTEYQQGTLQGYEVREFLLEKWQRTCAYCGVHGVPLEVEHIIPRSRGGGDSVRNLTLSCRACNETKGNRLVEEFLKRKPEVLKRVLETASKPLSDAAAVNATRWELYRRLQANGLPVEIGSGGLTKFNRTRLGLEKSHWTDAACVGRSTPEKLKILVSHVLSIKATGHGTRQMCGTNKHGFPIRHRSNNKKHFGFETGDMVKAVVNAGKKVSVYVGRVLCRKSGSFDITTTNGRVAGINHRHCRAVHLNDGYAYS